MDEFKYLRVVKETYLDDTKDKLTLTQYDTDKDAIKAYHRRIIEAMDNDNVKMAMVALIRDDGFMMKAEQWKADIPLPVDPEE